MHPDTTLKGRPCIQEREEGRERRGEDGRERGRGEEKGETEGREEREPNERLWGMRHTDRDATGRTTKMPQANLQPRRPVNRRKGREGCSQSVHRSLDIIHCCFKAQTYFYS